ncbi:hypothetical protein QUF72_03250, partial [Desulfobacterales bacterium HSG2]|nr:hypothetical protein [Desulfobacterales bacterium HSG2]
KMGHFFSSDPESTAVTKDSPPPVIPGRTEKMGHFFSSDPESTAVTKDSLRLSFRAELKKWDIFSVLTRNPPLSRRIPSACHSGQN